MSNKLSWICRECGSTVYFNTTCGCMTNSKFTLVPPEKENKPVTIMGFRGEINDDSNI